ncbi:MAG: DUF1851 domain-containing protein [Planctomycetia bacterium]|nr:DUF1851 domain-containing protein [Planctomycetia bacterium]
MFPRAAGRIIPFGCSWIGYYYALDLQQNCNGHHGCALLLFSHNKAVGAPMSVADLHRKMVVNTNGILEYELYRQWREKDQEPIAPNECVGFKVPLCLNGKFAVDNLERSDLSVYIGLTTQIWEAIRNLPEGTRVDQIRFE